MSHFQNHRIFFNRAKVFFCFFVFYTFFSVYFYVITKSTQLMQFVCALFTVVVFVMVTKCVYTVHRQYKIYFMYSVLILFYFIFLTGTELWYVFVFKFNETSPHDLSVVTCTKHQGIMKQSEIDLGKTMIIKRSQKSVKIFETKIKCKAPI